ncbi:MAG TPA: hypothetical protein VKY26_11510 [Actinomycetota bacterium]|nr:hypothetical protein [Actinomycetota bacterium]
MSRYRPFSNGTQAMDWTEPCERCGHEPTCSIYAAIAKAYCTDGTVSEEIARRMGFLRPDGTEAGRSDFRCTEFDPASGPREVTG